MHASSLTIRTASASDLDAIAALEAVCFPAAEAASRASLAGRLTVYAGHLWLVEETTRYMFRLLAAKQVLEHPKRYGFLLKKHQHYPPFRYRTDTIKGPVDTLANYAIKQGITYRQLKEHNPWLRSTKLTNKTRKRYIIQIPQ